MFVEFKYGNWFFVLFGIYRWGCIFFMFLKFFRKLGKLDGRLCIEIQEGVSSFIYGEVKF